MAAKGHGAWERERGRGDTNGRKKVSGPENTSSVWRPFTTKQIFSERLESRGAPRLPGDHLPLGKWGYQEPGRKSPGGMEPCLEAKGATTHKDETHWGFRFSRAAGCAMLGTPGTSPSILHPPDPKPVRQRGPPPLRPPGGWCLLHLLLCGEGAGAFRPAPPPPAQGPSATDGSFS